MPEKKKAIDWLHGARGSLGVCRTRAKEEFHYGDAAILHERIDAAEKLLDEVEQELWELMHL